MHKKNFFSGQTNKYADKVVNNNYTKNKHNTPFTHAAGNAVKYLGFTHDAATNTYSNFDGRTISKEEAIKINNGLNENFNSQKKDDYLKLANLPIVNQKIVPHKMHNQDLKNQMKTWIAEADEERKKNNPTVNRYRQFKENKKRELEDKKFNEEYSDQAIRNHVRAKVNKNVRAGNKPYANLSMNDIIVNEDSKDKAKKKLKAEPTIPHSSFNDLHLLNQTVRSITPTKSFEDHYREIVDRENNTTGITSLLKI